MQNEISQTQNCSAIRDKRFPPCIVVNGEVLIYSSNGKANFIESESPGINPTILILDVEVIEGDGPMKGVYSKIESFEKCVDEQKYKQATIRYNDDEITIDIFG